MDRTTTSSRGYRPDLRHRRRAQITGPSKQQAQRATTDEGRPQAPAGHPSLLRQERDKQRVTMTKDHRFYHRRKAQAATRVLTVNVEVVATVDSSGNLVGQETRTQDGSSTPTLGAAVDSLGDLLPSVATPAASAVVDVVDSVAAPAISAVVNAVDSTVPPILSSAPIPPQPSLPQVPSVPPFPTDALPVVPSVPPFPSGLSVPAYPFASGASSASVQAAQASTAPVTPSPVPTSVPASSAVPAALSVLPFPLSNSTTSSTASSSISASIASLSGAISSTSLSTSEPTVSSSRLSSASDVDETELSRTASATASSSAVNPTFYGGAGAGEVAITAAPPTETTAAVGASATGNITPLETPQVVGSVVGSLAGAALIFAVILLLLRRHRRKRQGALQLTNDEPTERAQPMTHDVSRNNRIPSTFLNRFSGLSRSTAETSTSAGGERGFQRVSGRKLPSAFSEGMTSDQFSHGGTISGSSFYQDDHGTYGGPGLSKEMGKEVSATPVSMSFRPSPARTPIIRHPDDDANPFADPPFPTNRPPLSPPQSPNPDIPRNTLGRSLQSADGSRSSKFTENV